MRSWFLFYFLTVTAVVALSLVYLNQRRVILQQGYEIAGLKCQIEDVGRLNARVVADIQALKRPDRCRSVLGERMAEFARPSDSALGISGHSSELPAVAVK